MKTFMRTGFAYFQISRPLNGLIAALGVWVGAQFALRGAGLEWSGENALSALLASIATVLALSAGNALNDSCDVDIDRVNRPDRPIPSGRLTARQARRFAALCGSLSLFAAYLVGWKALAVASAAAALLAAYASFLKRLPLLGNLAVALLVSAAFFAGGIAVQEPRRALPPMLLIFLFTAARETVKDIEDMEGDALHNANTAPIAWGEGAAKAIAASLALTGALLCPVPYLLGWDGFGAPYLIAVLLGVCAPVCWALTRLGRSARQAQQTFKICAVIGLIAVYIG